MKKPTTPKNGELIRQDNYNPKSTATPSQLMRLLDALLSRPHHSYELRGMGIYEAPARISDLRKQGYNITTQRINIVDGQGYSHRGIALYTLHKETDNE